MVETRAGNACAGQYDNVACPFCGLLCDDLSVAVAGGDIKVTKNGCDRAKWGFERHIEETSPLIGGKSVTYDNAVAEAARLISAARLPVFGGLGTDVDGMRAVMSIADKACGVVGHAFSEGQYRNYRVLQSGGWVTTTLTEARNRADLFVFLGSDIHKLHPRFFERIVCNEKSMFSDNPPKRTVIFIGEGLDQSAAVGSRIGEVITLPCKADRIGEVMAAVRAMAKGAPVHGDTIGGLPRAQVEDLLARCKAASYGVMVWAPPSLTFANADLTVQAAAEFIKELNLTQRFAGLSLGGNEGAVTAGAVCAWQSGFPLRVSFASGKPDYDPERYGIMRLIESKETDLLVWIASYSTDLSPPKSDVPMIVIGTPGLNLPQAPLVHIPVGTPGADHDGLLIRCDNVVSLPLTNLHRTNLPRVSDILSAIEAAL